MSSFDNCLFYRNNPLETTYVLVYVDDTFVFTNHPDHLQTDMDATSFLGLQLTHNPDKSLS